MHFLVVIYTKPPEAKYDVGDRLADMAKVTGSFAQAVLEYIRMRRLCLEEDSENEELLSAVESAKARALEIRKAAVLARTSMLTCISEAALSPSEGFSIHVHSLAPNLAADLVTAVVIPQSAFLFADGSAADGLLSDLNQATFSELDRLVYRLESQALMASATAVQPTTIASTPDGRGPFSNAIASAHRRLDEAGIRPSRSDK